MWYNHNHNDLVERISANGNSREYASCAAAAATHLLWPVLHSPEDLLRSKSSHAWHAAHLCARTIKTYAQAQVQSTTLKSTLRTVRLRGVSTTVYVYVYIYMYMYTVSYTHLTLPTNREV